MTLKRQSPSLCLPMYPKDTNGTATNIFGGALMGYMNSAGITACKAVSRNRAVTVAFDSIVFKQPVHVDDELTCWTEITAIGNTSIDVDIEVEVLRAGKRIPVTQGKAVYVTVDAQGKKTRVIGWNGKHPRRRPRRSGKDTSVGTIITAADSAPDAIAFKHSGQWPNIIVPMHPKDAGATWTDISAGVIMGYMDSAAAIACRKICKNRVVTVAFDSIVFKQPVHVSDILYVWANVTAVGNTSIKTDIIVEALRDGKQIPVTVGRAVFVSVDDNGHKIAVVGWN